MRRKLPVIPLLTHCAALMLVWGLSACSAGPGASRPVHRPVKAKPPIARPAPVRGQAAGPVRDNARGNVTAAVVRPPVRQAPPPARRQVLPGLEGVIGAGRDQLISQFGPARLDVYEGDVRKLQFTGSACVLDVFLYPSAPGRDPQASYVEARRASDGQDVDDVACVNALRKRP